MIEAIYPPGLVAIPAIDWMWTESARAFMELQGCLPAGSIVRARLGSSSPAANRNKLVEFFLSEPSYQWCLFIDSDMTPEPQTALRLLSRNVGIVSPLCFQRFEPYSGAWSSNGPPFAFNTGMHRVETVGAACLMVRREILEAMPYPWFDHPAPGTGEDILFCLKARQLGHEIFVDSDFCVGHMQSRRIGTEEAAEFRDSARGAAMLANPMRDDPAQAATRLAYERQRTHRQA